MKTMKISVTILLMCGLVTAAISCKKNDSSATPLAQKDVR